MGAAGGVGGSVGHVPMGCPGGRAGSVVERGHFEKVGLGRDAFERGRGRRGSDSIGPAQRSPRGTVIPRRHFRFTMRTYRRRCAAGALIAHIAASEYAARAPGARAAGLRCSARGMGATVIPGFNRRAVCTSDSEAKELPSTAIAVGGSRRRCFGRRWQLRLTPDAGADRARAGAMAAINS